MRKKVVLITGASGEIGVALVKQLAETSDRMLLTLDLATMPAEISHLSTHIVGNILDNHLLARLVSEYEFDTIFHLAALLSTRGEYTPEVAHKVNVEGTLGLLKLAADQSQWRGSPVQFIFPSSIAVYGIPDLSTKASCGKVRETEWNEPTTMYGCNKLYGEMVGIYYCRHYRQLAAEKSTMLDFRSVRFPGLISAFTIPSGGTSDYGPEMLHAAAQGKPYACFVRQDSRIPFMAMPDGVTALLQLAEAPRHQLSRLVYNINSFSLSAAEFRDKVLEAFPQANISFVPDQKRQGIIDSWPPDLDDSLAKQDWGWQPHYDVDRAFKEYLLPNIQQRYKQ